MTEIKIMYLPVKNLTPFENNARQHDDTDIENVVTSIKKYGFLDPIGIWSDKNIIVEGHARLEAAKRIGLKKVPCIRLDFLTEKQRREYTIAHNATAEMSCWNSEKLKLELPNLDLHEFNFNLPSYEDIDWASVEELNEDNYEKPEKDMLECPACHHIDSRTHFVKVKDK